MATAHVRPASSAARPPRTRHQRKIVTLVLELERRWIPLEGSRNFRDLGGYTNREGRRVRWRHLFRADALGTLSDGDVQRVRGELGVRTVVDLRHARECALKGTAAFADGETVRLHHLPLNRTDVPDDDPLPEMDDLGAVYLWISRGVGPVLARVMQCIAADDAVPLVFHCAAGKDRTGIIAAVLLELLGVPDEVIVADYALTELVGQDIRPEDRAAVFHAYQQDGPPAEALNARPHHMVTFLEGIRTVHGSVRDYVATYGVNEPLIARLRERLLE